MKLKPIKQNMTVVTIDDATDVLFSYETPVAARIGDIYYKTDHKWSRTTSRHISQYLNGSLGVVRPQEFFDRLGGK